MMIAFSDSKSRQLAVLVVALAVFAGAKSGYAKLVTETINKDVDALSIRPHISFSFKDNVKPKAYNVEVTLHDARSSQPGAFTGKVDIDIEVGEVVAKSSEGFDLKKLIHHDLFKLKNMLEAPKPSEYIVLKANGLNILSASLEVEGKKIDVVKVWRYRDHHKIEFVALMLKEKVTANQRGKLSINYEVIRWEESNTCGIFPSCSKGYTHDKFLMSQFGLDMFPRFQYTDSKADIKLTVIDADGTIHIDSDIPIVESEPFGSNSKKVQLEAVDTDTIRRRAIRVLYN